MNRKQLNKSFIKDYESTFQEVVGKPLIKTKRGRVLSQNEQPADVRMAYIDYVESMRVEGAISEQVAVNATL